jgi:quinol monooxygenase YgiN
MWKLSAGPPRGSGRHDFERIRSELESLVGTVREIEELRVGANVNPSDAAFDVVLETAFASREALAAYQSHPAHQQVAETVGALTSDRAVVDYEY